MGAVALSGFLSDDGQVTGGTVVTVVLPGGCPARCGFCIVRHRNERESLSAAPPPEYFTGFLRRYAEAGRLAGGAIIGDEPLQEAIWPYVSQFLGFCTAAERPSTLTTNGFFLHRFVKRLEAYPLTSVVVSVDALDERHDRIRGLPGLFAAVGHGIEAAVAAKSLSERLSIATILRPQRLKDAEAVLRWVSRMGVTRWMISPLLDPRPNQSLRLHGQVASDVVGPMRQLGGIAKALGVTMIAADEFALIPSLHQIGREAGFTVKQPLTTPSLIRVDAQGNVWTLDDLKLGVVRADRAHSANDVNTTFAIARAN